MRAESDLSEAVCATGMMLIYAFQFYHIEHLCLSSFSQKPPKLPLGRRGPPNLQLKPPRRSVRLKTQYDAIKVVEEPVQAEREENPEKPVIR